ncbi:hypothetical protein [Parapedobacter tibetensis]|uniref:hypothetical protein n=1 Tax=Parapedobacter tibetensis TaxID=2972951 RepID=UPI00214DCF71|nr:hypothetical protein [Parapedobacter tibetensis]
MEKYYSIGGNQVKVIFNDGLVGIVNDMALKQAVDMQPEESVDLLVVWIKEDYLLEKGEPLVITDNSFVVEIWGHVYVDYFLLKYKTLLRVILAFGLYARFCKSCEVIDCGERGKDPNRRLWDALAPYRKAIAKWKFQ